MGGRDISVGEFTTEIERTRGNVADEKQKEDLLEKMIRGELLHAAALRQGYDKDPEIVAQLGRMIAAKYRRERLEPELEKLSVTEEEVQGYYRDHQEEFAVPRMVRPAIIEIKVPARATPETRAELARRAEEALAAARALDPATRSFGSVAVKYSEDQASRYRGGEIGPLRVGQEDLPWGPEVVAAIFALAAPGDLSPVIATPTGFYLAKLMDIKEGAQRPLDQVRAAIGQKLLTEKRARTEEAFFEELAGLIPVTIDRELLKTIELPEKPGAGAPPPLPAQ